MPGNYRIATIVLFVFGAYDAVAQTAPPDPPPPVELKTIPRRFVTDELRIWTSPFQAKSYNSHVIKKYVVPFALLSATLIATDRHTGHILPNTDDQQKWSGRVSQIGASYTLAGISGATYLIGKVIGDAHAKEAGLLSLEAMGHSQVAIFAFKQLTNRVRPVDHDGGGSFWKGGNSFPSGHAAASFAMATVFAYEYREQVIVPITAYSLAGLVSAARIGARRHWVSDIVVGGGLGFLIGRFTYRRNHNPALPGSPVNRLDRLTPQVAVSGSSVVLSWHLSN